MNIDFNNRKWLFNEIKLDKNIPSDKYPDEILADLEKNDNDEDSIEEIKDRLVRGGLAEVEDKILVRGGLKLKKEKLN